MSNQGDKYRPVSNLELALAIEQTRSVLLRINAALIYIGRGESDQLVTSIEEIAEDIKKLGTVTDGLLERSPE